MTKEAGQSEPVEDSCGEACPPCFDKLSMTPDGVWAALVIVADTGLVVNACAV